MSLKFSSQVMHFLLVQRKKGRWIFFFNKIFLIVLIFCGSFFQGVERPGLPGWFRHAYFDFHSHVRLRFKLAAGLGRPWTRDGGIPQGCPLSMMFIVALNLPWCS